ncbi:MAG: T9SS type A sorting domain-containing protein [Saprospiraceae bacterium]|nr:T9SS type A sorting domain-containing protein [Saprospiraceae bacterium]
MKNIVLPALCWALAISQLFAQKTLPPSVAAYSDNWSNTVKKSLKAAGFNLPSPAAQPDMNHVLNTRSSELQLDSTHTFYDYGLNGNDSLPIYRTIYTYPAEGIKVQIDYQIENNTWMANYRITLIYDEQERLVETIAESYDTSIESFILDSRIEVFPHSNSPNLVDSTFVSVWNPAVQEWLPVTSIWNNFDGEGKIVESLTLVEIFGLPLQYRDLYTYDSNGDNTLIESFAVKAAENIPTSNIEMEYQNHFLKLETNLNFDGIGGFVPETQTAYSYTDFDQLEKVESYEWDFSANDWFNTQSDSYEYDDLQRLSAKETVRHFQGEEERSRFTYAYMEDENFSLETSYFWDIQTNNFLLDTRKYYFYSGGVSAAPYIPQPVYALNMSPNPTTRFAQIQLESEVSVQVFDGMGRLVQWQNDESGQINLDMSELPAGIYTIRALDGSKFYVGKLVKQ